MFSDQSNTGTCTPCGANTFAAMVGYRIACTTCPPNTVSGIRTTSIEGCVDEFKELNTSWSRRQGYCTGSAAGGLGASNALLAFKPISKSQCQDFVTGHNKLLSGITYNFTDAPPNCDDVAPEECENIAKGNLCSSSVVHVHGKSPSEACPVSCGLCISRFAATNTGGVSNNATATTLPAPHGCVIEGDGVARTVRYYTTEAHKQYVGVPYIPVCTPHYCDIDLQEVTRNAVQS